MPFCTDIVSDLAADWCFAFECLHLQLKEVLCDSVRRNPVVSIQGCSWTVTEALLESRKPHILSMCVYSYSYMCLYKHMCKHAYTQPVCVAKGCIHHLLLCQFLCSTRTARQGGLQWHPILISNSPLFKNSMLADSPVPKCKEHFCGH